jgi:peptide/nickel transport system substrate-binding protein
MSRRAICLVVATLVVSCTAGANKGPSPVSPAVGLFVARGGTLHLGTDRGIALDPRSSTGDLSLEVFRCCLLRTLYSTNGLSVAQGGSLLQPDLAVGPPHISTDGLTWTFSIKRGLRYGPPFTTTEITSPDFVRALEREAEAADASYAEGSGSIYSVISGFDAFASGRTRSITGLATPDEHTLVIELTQQTGDLAWRLAMPAAAPVPPLPEDPSSPIRRLVDQGRFVVSSGPYMLDGSASVGSSTGTGVVGFEPGQSLKLVRNPSWHEPTDPLRPAYAAAMDISMGNTSTSLYASLSSGRTDAVLGVAPPPSMLSRYVAAPALRTRLFVDASNQVEFASMNLAAPPFDDMHVRRAVNMIVDKDTLVRIRGGTVVAHPADHIFPDASLGGDLQTYAPYSSDAGSRESGALDAAKAEMARSKYAGPGGICGAAVCDGVTLLFPDTPEGTDTVSVLRQDLGALGISLDVKAADPATLDKRCSNAPAHVQLCLSLRSPLYLDPYPFAWPAFSTEGLWPLCCNGSLIGATSAQLQRWSYVSAGVPSVQDRIDRCEAIATSASRNGCWSDLDRYLMEQAVPWVPLVVPQVDTIVSDHITNFSFDLFSGTVALDHLATDRTS